MNREKNGYLEIDDIQRFIKKNKVSVDSFETKLIDENLVPLILKIGVNEWQIQVMDEYQDLEVNNSNLNVVLVLRELELIIDSTDYLQWCKQQSIVPNNDKLLAYFKAINGLIPEIQVYFPNRELTSFISDLDFQLNQGPAQYIRNMK
jgi:hypothetical protein